MVKLPVTFLCYVDFAPENPEDGEMYLLVWARVCVCVCARERRVKYRH